MASASPYIELDYKFRDEPRKYRVYLSVPSNLGASEVWYFLCPHTGKRCRILYCVEGEFLHQEAFRGVCYDIQIEGKKMRNYMRVVGSLFKADKLHKPYFKRYYKPKSTKKYLKIIRQLARADKISIEDFERILIRW